MSKSFIRKLGIFWPKGIFATMKGMPNVNAVQVSVYVLLSTYVFVCVSQGSSSLPLSFSLALRKYRLRRRIRLGSYNLPLGILRSEFLDDIFAIFMKIYPPFFRDYMTMFLASLTLSLPATMLFTYTPSNVLVAMRTLQ